jgi:outer membrane protein insertion porin family
MIRKLILFLSLLATYGLAWGGMDHPRYLFIKDVTFSGNRSIRSSQLQEVLGIRKGDIYSNRKLQEGLERVKRLYVDRGYVFMRVMKVTPWVFDSDVILKVTLDEGIIGRIDVIGNCKTRTEVIKRELLFREGDPYNSEDARESERILRRKSYLGDVEITARFDGDMNAVAVTVKVTDLWTFFPFISFPISKEGNSKLIVGLNEMNLFGYGQSLGLRYEREGVDGVRHRIGGTFSDPRIIGTHWHFLTSYFSQPIGDSWRLSLTRPLYSLKARWSARIGTATIHDTIRWYENGEVKAEYQHASAGWNIALTHSTGTRRRYTRLSIWYSYREDLFTLVGTPEISTPLRDRKLGTLGVTTLHASSEFVQDRFVDKLGEVEDIELGSGYEISLFHSNRIYGSDRNETGILVRFSSASRVYQGDYLRSEIGFKSNLRETVFENPVLSGQVRYLLKNPSSPQSLAFRVTWQFGMDSHLPRQILLGSNNGLRGYRPNRFDGDKMILLNAEARLVFFRSRYIVLGGVLFADMGYIWRGPITDFDLRGPRRGAGLGLRVELPRLNGSPIYRLDIGYPLDAEEGDPERIISFGLGHVF